MKKQTPTTSDQNEQDEELGWVEHHPAFALLLVVVLAVLVVVGGFFLFTTYILKPLIYFLALIIGLALIGS